MKIGAAIIACDRVEYTKQCVASLMANKGPLDEIVLINDGLKLPEGIIPEGIHVIDLMYGRNILMLLKGLVLRI
jgi:hypothetical protein